MSLAQRSAASGIAPPDCGFRGVNQTEQGIAEISGRPEKEQARAIIENAAHPSVRAELWEEAGYLGLV